MCITYNDKQSSLLELLEKASPASIHMRNIQSKAIEMFCACRNISLPIKNYIFKQKDKSWYNLRQISKFVRPLEKSVYNGGESVSFPGPKIWDMSQDYYKEIGI